MASLGLGLPARHSTTNPPRHSLPRVRHRVCRSPRPTTHPQPDTAQLVHGIRVANHAHLPTHLRGREEPAADDGEGHSIGANRLSGEHNGPTTR